MADQTEWEGHKVYLEQAKNLAKKLGDRLGVSLKFKEFKRPLWIFEFEWGGKGIIGVGSSFGEKWWTEIRRHGFRMMWLDVDYVEHKIVFHLGYNPYKLVVIDE